MALLCLLLLCPPTKTARVVLYLVSEEDKVAVAEIEMQTPPAPTTERRSSILLAA